jgi:hypothetical protein
MTGLPINVFSQAEGPLILLGFLKWTTFLAYQLLAFLAASRELAYLG